MKTVMTGTFRRAAKKLHRNQIKSVEDVIAKIQSEPLLGEMKIGDLAGVRVHKFNLVNQLVLLAYTYNQESDELTLLSLASHENFYKNLKNRTLLS